MIVPIKKLVHLMILKAKGLVIELTSPYVQSAQRF